MIIQIPLVNKSTLEISHEEVEFIRSKKTSIAQGKCFVRIKATDHHFAITEKTYLEMESKSSDLFDEGEKTLIDFTDYQFANEQKI